jgi:hypothetical protein
MSVQVIVERGRLALAGVPRLQRRHLRRDVHVLRVGCRENAAVRRLEVRHLQDLLGAEVAEIDHADAAVRAVVDVKPAAVILAVGLAQRRVMRVAPPQVGLAVGDGVVGRVRSARGPLPERALRPVGAVAIALPRLGCEDGNRLQQPHRRHANHVHLARMTARREQHVFVAPSRRHEGLEGPGGVLGAQTARLRNLEEPCLSAGPQLAARDRRRCYQHERHHHE